MSQEKEITVEEAVENQNPEAAQTEQPQPNAEDPNKVVLLGTISYNDEKEYSKWLSEMDVNQAVFVLIAGANFSQAKAAYNLQESELSKYLAKIRTETLLAYGVYQIEADGMELFEYIKGDQDSIMGLPINDIINYIKQYNK